MKTKIFILLILFLGMMGCRSQQPIPTVKVESTKMDSTSQKTDILIQRVQNLISEINVWEHRRDSVAARDSIAVRDSTIIYMNESGDVIAKERYRDKIQKTDRASSSESDRHTEITRQYIDSLLSAQKMELMEKIEESRQVPIPMERNLTKWEQVKQDVGVMSIGILIVIVVIAVAWLIKKFKNQR